MRNFVLLFLLLGFSVTSSAQKIKSKEISGTITYLNAPLKDVNILVKGSSLGTKTNKDGKYVINTNVGDKLVYSYVGFDTVTILIEDVTNVLNIEMDNYVTKLDEVIVEGTAKTKKSAPGDEYNRKIKTSYGNINPMLLPDSRYFSRDRIATQYRTLSDALKFYYPKGLPMNSFEVDGKIFDFEPYVKMSTIRDIYVATIKSAKFPSGHQIMIIRTTNSEEYREVIAEKHKNQNYYNADAVATTSESTFSSSNLTKDISGKVTHLFAPIPNVNINIKGTSKGTKTDDKGDYSLQVNIGDIIEYSHVKFTTVAIMVEDVTSTLNIELQEKNNKLDEIVLTAKRSPKDLATFEEKMDAEIRTSFGIFKPNATATKVHYLSGEELGTHYADLPEALKGKFSGKLPGSYDVDGLPYNSLSISALNLAIIKDVYVTKNVIVVQTMDSPEEIARRQEAKAEKHRNQNYYSDDALVTNTESTFSSSNLTKDISGKVTHLFAPIPNVNITIKGTSKGTKTNDKGEYSLQANVGDILEYSHVAYTTVAVMIEDVTSTLNIELQEKDNKLDEVVVKGRVDQKALEYEKKMNVDLKTPFGNFNPKKSGFSINHISGKDLNNAAPSIAYALSGKAPGVTLISTELFFQNDPFRPAIYVVDGIQINSTYLINTNNIEDVYTISNKNLVVIRTINSPDVQTEKRNNIAEQYQNQNYYNADAATKSDETTFSSTNIKTSQPKFIVTKEISGKVTYLDAPMPLVNIKIVGKNSGVTTSPKGAYNLDANVGDIIQYSHVGFATVSIIVEDVTEILDIEMVEEQNELETVIVTADGTLGKTAEISKKSEQKFKTAMGTYDPKTSGNSSAYIDGNNLTAGARDILDVLNGKVAGVTVDRVNNIVKLRDIGSVNTEVPAIWDVDGMIVTSTPQIEPSNIKDIHLLKSLASTTRYGSAGRGGVIVVTTKSGDYSAAEANRNKIADKYTNKDYYANDASQISLASLNANSYADGLEGFSSKQKAFIYYDEKLKKQLPKYADHIAIAQKFVSYFNDLTLSTQIFKELIERNNKNPEALKAIAFHLQTIGRPKEAIEAYERTFKLRPQYAQSYRDLSNAYMENDQFKKSWRLYMSYLMQGNDVSTEGIGELIYNEMEWLYFSRRNQTDIKEKFIPKSENLFDFRNDVRIVVEWNSSEAEFDLEFVNPELRSYVFEHTLAGNQELITDEKEKGYSSKEFFIDDLKDGEWLVNITYKGNKKPEPTYFKITKFYNWGKATQTKEIAVYKFQNEREKIQLMYFNKALLVATN